MPVSKRAIPLSYRARWAFHRSRLSRLIRTNLRWRDPRRCPECGSYLPHLSMGATREDAFNHRWRMATTTDWLPEARR